MIELFYLQDSRNTVGNDLLFWAKGCNGYTTDLLKAHVFSRDEAERMHRSRPTDIPWPKQYIDNRTRTVVDSQSVDRSVIKKAGIKITKPKPPPKYWTRVNCVGCGRFLFDAAIYQSCPNCGESNAL